jgi:hypothetical protein
VAKPRNYDHKEHRPLSRRQIRTLIGPKSSGPKRTLSADEVEQLNQSINQVVLRGRAQGWKEIALLLGMNERNARRAYRNNLAVRRVVYKIGGRYWGEPGEIALALAGQASEQRKKVAREKARSPGGRFKQV